MPLFQRSTFSNRSPVSLKAGPEAIQIVADAWFKSNADIIDPELPPAIEIKPPRKDPERYDIYIAINGETEISASSFFFDVLASIFLDMDQTAVFHGIWANEDAQFKSELYVLKHRKIETITSDEVLAWFARQALEDQTERSDFHMSAFSRSTFMTHNPVKLTKDKETIDAAIQEWIEKYTDRFDPDFAPVIEIEPDETEPDKYNIYINIKSDLIHDAFDFFFCFFAPKFLDMDQKAVFYDSVADEDAQYAFWLHYLQDGKFETLYSHDILRSVANNLLQK